MSLLRYYSLICRLDHDHFLPSAIQRYHQLLLPALQLVNTILATLGSGHSVAVNHVVYHFLILKIDTLTMFRPWNFCLAIVIRSP